MKGLRLISAAIISLHSNNAKTGAKKDKTPYNQQVKFIIRMSLNPSTNFHVVVRDKFYAVHCVFYHLLIKI